MDKVEMIRVRNETRKGFRHVVLNSGVLGFQGLAEPVVLLLMPLSEVEAPVTADVDELIGEIHRLRAEAVERLVADERAEGLKLLQFPA